MSVNNTLTRMLLAFTPRTVTPNFRAFTRLPLTLI